MARSCSGVVAPPVAAGKGTGRPGWMSVAQANEQTRVQVRAADTS